MFSFDLAKATVVTFKGAFEIFTFHYAIEKTKENGFWFFELEFSLYFLFPTSFRVFCISIFLLSRINVNKQDGAKQFVSFQKRCDKEHGSYLKLFLP